MYCAYRHQARHNPVFFAGWKIYRRVCLLLTCKLILFKLDLERLKMRALNDVRYNGHKKFSEKSKSKEVGCPMKNRENFF